MFRFCITNVLTLKLLNCFFFILQLFVVHYKEGRPRNLGRGVSKPKKNTVASLLAQSRAVGLKPILSTHQLLSQGADLVSKIKRKENKR